MDIDLSHLNTDECLKIRCAYVCIYIYMCVCTPMRYWDLTITMIGVMRENINNTGPECSTKTKKIWGNWGPVRPR